MSDRETLTRAVLCWCVLGACALAAAAGCGARATEPQNDSQAHWLRACDGDDDCGGLSCLCGVCSVPCSASDECGAPGGLALSCIEPSADADCTNVVQGSGLCLSAECTSDGCAAANAGASRSASDSDGEEIIVRGMAIPPSAVPVPECPELAKTTGLPPFFMRTEMGDYEGIATVNQITTNELSENVVVLVPNEIVGASLELAFNRPETPDFLPLGQRVHMMVQREPGMDEQYMLLTVRDDAGKLLLASYRGDDSLYQDGMFSTRDAVGATLSLTLLCQSSIGDACFTNQVQADFTGTFTADDTITLDSPDIGELSIGGAPYDVNFSASSVGGDERAEDCPLAEPTRSLHFTLFLLE